jgi:hypothetical protein
MLLWLFERADDALPLPVRAPCFYSRQPPMPAAHLQSSYYLRCKIHSVS